MYKKIEMLEKIFKKYIEISPELHKILFADIDYIYHYTNFEAFKSIVHLDKVTKQNGLWLSNARFLNDAEEIDNGKKLMLTIAESITKKNPNFNVEKIKEKINQSNDEYYICSFSGIFDSLDQWRNYSRNGNGICLELCVKDKDNYFNNLQYNGKGLVLKKILYEDTFKNEFLESFQKLIKGESVLLKEVTKFADKYLGIKDISLAAMAGIRAAGVVTGLGLFLILGSVIGAGIGKTMLDSKKNREKEIEYSLRTIGIEELNEHNLIDNLVKSLNIYYPFFKNEKFKSEDEIRLVYYDDIENSTLKDIINFRVSVNNMIVPYIRTQDLLPNGMEIKLPISRVIIGPTVNKEWTEDSVRFFLDNNGYNKVPIIPSKVPYRG